ncbi:MAG: FAD/NAD(P)-binding oxidoreductase [Oceanospirillum sp.]|nr:FAD/NAD(P)-binding oxidoreductase [Oceanospirillum sp.]
MNTTASLSIETQQNPNAAGAQSSYDLVIIGAGPAGMSAASTACQHGLRVALLDEQPNPGGQIYRAIGPTALQDEKVLGPDYYAGRQLLADLHQALDSNNAVTQGLLHYFSGSMVWSIEQDQSVCFSQQTFAATNSADSENSGSPVKQTPQTNPMATSNTSRRINANKILIATGAMERPVPFPGWTLPGVMTCGSAQILLKQSALAPKMPLVLAGSGPLLLLIAAQLHRAGVEISAVLDTTPKGRYRKALKYLPGALKNLPLLKKGLELLLELKQAGIHYEKHVTGLKALSCSDGQPSVKAFDPAKPDMQPIELLQQVEYSVNGKIHHRPCQTLLVHQGVVPNVQLSRALRLGHQWNTLQQCWAPEKNTWGRSSHADIFIAGDGGGIAGAKAAEYQGKIAALKIAQTLGYLTEDQLLKHAEPFRSLLDKQQAIRPFLDQLYQPADEFLTPADDTLVCRCEEVTAGEIRAIAAKGIAGPNQTKAFCRSGMGPCQGRMCGLTVSNLIAEVQGKKPEEVGYYQIRSPIKPLTLEELADLAQ